MTGPESLVATAWHGSIFWFLRPPLANISMTSLIVSVAWRWPWKPYRLTWTTKQRKDKENQEHMCPSTVIIRSWLLFLFVHDLNVWQNEGLKVNHFIIFLVDLAGIQCDILSRKNVVYNLWLSLHELNFLRAIEQAKKRGKRGMVSLHVPSPWLILDRIFISLLCGLHLICFSQLFEETV